MTINHNHLISLYKKRMKIVLSLFFLLLGCMNLDAQELSVKSFEERSKDLSASTYPRKDLNGTPCALVKVQLASSGAQFEGNVIGNVEYKTSEYWVYMPEGSKRLKVKLEGYLPLDVEFGSHGPGSLQSKTTYVLTITGVVNGSNQPRQVRTQTGWIIIDSDPSGAAVYINDEFVGNTPLDSYKQAYGTYTYRVEKPNYHSATGVILLSAAKLEKKVTLLPAFGSIQITGGVNGATVLLDGKPTDRTTPCTLTEVPSGEHTVTLQASKYAPRQVSVTVTDGNISQMDATLDARFARVTVSTLNGADIYIDSKLKGTTSYTEDLMEGYYDVEARLAHHTAASRQIHVTAGQDQTVNLQPVPIYGSLDVTSTPRGATVTVDGRNCGETPLTIDNLLEGSHTVTLSLAGYASESRNVSISKDSPATVSATLHNGKEITISTEESGAEIFIDGNSAGISLFRGHLSFGSHSIYAMLNGKKSSVKTIDVSQSSSVNSIRLSCTDDQTFTVNGVSFEMKKVEGGTFTMGATSEQSDPYSDEKPTHRVTLSSFLIGKYEVTQELWKAVMGNNPSYFKGDNLPVEKVSWDDCQKFISRLNSLTGKRFRLPTEAEWEYAARGGNKSRHYKYSGSDNLDAVAWYDGNSNEKTHPVGIRFSNELGLYDMSGNVWEWCQDRYGDYSSSPQTNPTGPSSGSCRVFRGGSWFGNAGRCRMSIRGDDYPGYRCYDLGFRLVLSE